MSRRIEIEAYAYPEGALGATCSATVEMTIPDEENGRDLAFEMTQTVGRTLAALWSIPAEEVRASVHIVEQTRQVISGGDVKIRTRSKGGRLWKTTTARHLGAREPLHLPWLVPAVRVEDCPGGRGTLDRRSTTP